MSVKGKQQYYSAKKILETGAQYLMLIGERSNGKSYQAKHYALQNAWETGKATFVYLRRWRIDATSNNAITYFADYPVEILTKGKYNCITAWSKFIYFGNIDEDGKITKGQQCGHIMDLSGAEHYKSLAYPDVTDIIFEEFITNSRYLGNDEPDILMDLVSTVARRRSIRVWLIGNTISRICPYVGYWGLQGLPKMKIGQIDTYDFETDQYNEDGTPVIVKVAVEYCENSGSNSKMFFGEHAKAITGGAWETKIQPKLLRKYEEYTICHEILVIYQGFQFVLQLLSNDDGGLINYVYPYTGTRNIRRIIQHDFSDLPNVSSGFEVERIKAEAIMLNNLRVNKTCYSDNLTGGEFKQVIEMLTKC